MKIQARKRKSFWFNAHGVVILGVLAAAQFGSALPAFAQTVTDKVVATIGGSPHPVLITYSDLVWQLALQPDTPRGSQSSAQLNTALQLIISQRLILQEAERLPGVSPTDKEVSAELTTLIKSFPSPTDFSERTNSVGLTADQLHEIVRERVEIEKYLDFRFRSFTVVSASEISDYYTQVWVPGFRRRLPDSIVPTLEKAQTEIEKTLTEGKVESQIDQFVASARDRAEIIIVNPV